MVIIARSFGANRLSYMVDPALGIVFATFPDAAKKQAKCQLRDSTVKFLKRIDNLGRKAG